MNPLDTNPEPVNREAAMLFAKGVKQNLRPVEGGRIHSDVPLKTRKLQKLYGELDLTGTRQGRLTVIGISADVKGRHVVRCDCGNYELRTAKSIRNPDNKGDRCEHCRRLAQARRSTIWRTEGRDVDVRDL